MRAKAPIHEISDVDLLSLSGADAKRILDTVYDRKVVVFRKQRMTTAEYIGVARKFGRPQVYLQSNYHHPEHPEIFVSSNVQENGKKVGVAGTGQYWHTDYQFMPEPLSLTMLYPQVLPAGKRETYYIDMERVLEELPAELRARIDGRRAIHEAKWRYKVTADDIDRSLTELLDMAEKIAPPVTHPVVITHPVTKRPSLYVSSGFTTGIEGYSHEANKALMAALVEFIERPEHVLPHSWAEGDVLLWDNRTLVHKASATPKGEKSSSYRIGVYDDLPFYMT